MHSKKFNKGSGTVSAVLRKKRRKIATAEFFFTITRIVRFLLLLFCFHFMKASIFSHNAIILPLCFNMCRILVNS